MSGQRVGYIRVSSVDQATDRQLDGVPLDRTFTDRASGKDTARPQLAAMLSFVREGDTVVAHSMDRLARNLDDLRALVRTLTSKGVRVEFVKEQLTFTGEDSPMANLLLSVMGAFAEFERALIRERQREGIALAKGRGVYRGRQHALTPAQAEQLRARVAAGDSKAAVARDFAISRQTVYQYLTPTAIVDGSAELAAVLATLPADERPLPSVVSYDELFPSRVSAAERVSARPTTTTTTSHAVDGILGSVTWPDSYRPACPHCQQPIQGLREKSSRHRDQHIVLTLAEPCGCGVDDHAVILQAGAVDPSTTRRGAGGAAILGR